MSGLLINGALIPVPGLAIIPPASHGGPAWAYLGPEDCRARPTSWVRLVVVHSTTGDWPQLVRPGAGTPGHAQQVAEMWSGRDHDGGERVHSAAQIVVDFDGTVACLCDLATVMAYHAEAVNPWSVGIEMSVHPDNSIQQATLTATAKLVAALTCSGTPGSGLFPVPAQMPRGPYRNAPMARMETGGGATRRQIGGPNVCGVVGHRDCTSERGRGDPGEAIWTELANLGFEGVDFYGEEDLTLGKQRQAALNRSSKLASPLTEDGVCGPSSIAAMKACGFQRWRDVV